MQIRPTASTIGLIIYFFMHYFTFTQNLGLTPFGIKRSLSHKGCPYDNAVSEATYKIFKTEFVMNKNFDSLDELLLQLSDYIDWFNNSRIHGSLGYLTPVEFKTLSLAK